VNNIQTRAMLTSHPRSASTAAATTLSAAIPATMFSPAPAILHFTSTTPKSIASGGSGRCCRQTSANSRAKPSPERRLSSTSHPALTARSMVRSSLDMLRDLLDRFAICCRLLVVLSVMFTYRYVWSPRMSFPTAIPNCWDGIDGYGFMAQLGRPLRWCSTHVCISV